MRMAGVFIDGRLEAFTIGSYNPVENMAVIHIEKANPEMNGLYQFIKSGFLVHEFPEVEWVNREDDLGIEGLRKAKMSYNRADFAGNTWWSSCSMGNRDTAGQKILEIHRPKNLSGVIWQGEEKQETRKLWGKSVFSRGFPGIL